MKGSIHNGECNRSACNNTGATFWNYSTRKWYCGECAALINAHNRADALRLFGHDLCLRLDKEPNNEPQQTKPE